MKFSSLEPAEQSTASDSERQRATASDSERQRRVEAGEKRPWVEHAARGRFMGVVLEADCMWSKLDSSRSTGLQPRVVLLDQLVNKLLELDGGLHHCAKCPAERFGTWSLLDIPPFISASACQTQTLAMEGRPVTASDPCLGSSTGKSETSFKGRRQTRNSPAICHQHVLLEPFA